MLFVVPGWGQLTDTSSVLLNTVEISGQKEKFLIGKKIEKISSFYISTNSNSSLADLLNSQLPLYIKKDAGSLSTLRLRGTSPDHVAVMYKGFNINSLTLGHSNISQIPVFLFDKIDVKYGSSSSLFGTDAIGGSINLGNSVRWNQGLKLGIQQEIGSFGEYFTGLNTYYSNKLVSIKIKGFHYQKENDFPFTNFAVKDFEKGEFVEDRSKNSSLKNFGILCQANVILSEKISGFVDAIYTDYWHQIQPNMSENYYNAPDRELYTNSFKLLSGIKYFDNTNRFDLSLAYIEDNQIYNNIDEQLIATKSYLAKSNYYYNSNIFDFNVGVNYSHIKPDVYTYEENLSEDRIEILALTKANLLKKLTASVNLRETIVLDYKNHFSPSFGVEYELINKKQNRLNLLGSYSYSFKTPTFNQRFWLPNANPDILPETGINYEIGANYRFDKSYSALDLNLTSYFMEVDNWIQWVNLGLWRPVNIKKVRNFGIEFGAKYKIITPKGYKLTTSVGYQYTNAKETKSYNDISKVKDKQLLYTPFNTGKYNLNLQYKDWFVDFSGSYTGFRYDGNYLKIDSYFLQDMAIGKDFSFNHHTLKLIFKVKNVFDKSYQNWKFYAMPGRSFSLNIKYAFIKTL